MGWLKDVLAPLTKQQTFLRDAPDRREQDFNATLLWADANVMTSPSSEGPRLLFYL